MPPTATEPKPTAAGASEIVASAGVVCWLDAGLLEAPVRPMQPEQDRIAENRRARAAAEIAFLSVEFFCVARFPAPPVQSFVLKFFFEFLIKAIVLWAEREGLLSQWTFEGQGWKPAPGTQVRREAAGRMPTALSGPPNSIRLNSAQSMGRWLKLRPSQRFPRRWNRPT